MLKNNNEVEFYKNAARDMVDELEIMRDLYKCGEISNEKLISRIDYILGRHTIKIQGVLVLKPYKS